jgi:hypothetical protein
MAGTCPQFIELLSIVDAGKASPAIDGNVFSLVDSSAVSVWSSNRSSIIELRLFRLSFRAHSPGDWTATPFAGNISEIWFVAFSFGGSGPNDTLMAVWLRRVHSQALASADP